MSINITSKVIGVKKPVWVGGIWAVVYNSSGLIHLFVFLTLSSNLSSYLYDEGDAGIHPVQYVQRTAAEEAEKQHRS